ncbi:hypothetical protein [Vibrio injensis]|uniref:hypothetical protein n=1 Tax=Vibrio injensis TaxID=1307414 RepID=UPI0009343789|nr:hypothetical protein [Vibrio injensis]
MELLFEIIKTLGGASALIAIIVYCCKLVIDTSIKKSLEEFKSELAFEQKKREQAALVAEAIAEWVVHPTEVDDIKQLQKLVWEATLWLPDDLAKNFNDMLAHKEKTAKEMLVDVKSHIWQKPTTLKPDDIVHFEVRKKT